MFFVLQKLSLLVPGITLICHPLKHKTLLLLLLLLLLFCQLCRFETEDVRHLFAFCLVSKEITRRLQNKMNDIINLYFNCNILLQSHNIVIGYLHTNKIIRIFVNFVIHVLKWELWKIRNLVKHETKLSQQIRFSISLFFKL